MRGINSNFDSNGATANFLAFQSSNGFDLLFLAANVHEAITLAFPGLTPPPADNASGGNSNSSFCEECGQTSIIDGKTEVGNKKHGLGRFTDGVLSRRANNARGPRFADTRLLDLSWRLLAFGCGRGRGSGWDTFGSVGVNPLAFTLDKEKSQDMLM